MSKTYTPPALPTDLAAKVAAMPFTATLTYRAPTHKAGPDRWLCSLNGEDFVYYKGTGLRVSVRDAATAWPDVMHPVDPTAPELLASLVMDAGCYSDADDLDDFAANFCDVQHDGIHAALVTYNACARADRLLRRWFTPDELDALREWESNL